MKETAEFYLSKSGTGGLGFSIAGGNDDPTAVRIHTPTPTSINP
jgi:hypothetical protein